MATSKRQNVVPLQGRATKRRRCSILVLSGPNLDRLGKREPELYGTTTLDQVYEELSSYGKKSGVLVTCRQSNYEGDLVTWIGQSEDDGFSGILLNAGSLTHTSYALHDALKGVRVPAVEVHVTNPEAREEWRRHSCVAPACIAKVSGFGTDSYLLALQGLLKRL